MQLPADMGSHHWSLVRVLRQVQQVGARRPPHGRVYYDDDDGDDYGGLLLALTGVGYMCMCYMHRLGSEVITSGGESDEETGEDQARKVSDLW